LDPRVGGTESYDAAAGVSEHAEQAGCEGEGDGEGGAGRYGRRRGRWNGRKKGRQHHARDTAHGSHNNSHKDTIDAEGACYGEASAGDGGAGGDDALGDRKSTSRHRSPATGARVWTERLWKKHQRLIGRGVRRHPGGGVADAGIGRGVQARRGDMAVLGARCFGALVLWYPTSRGVCET